MTGILGFRDQIAYKKPQHSAKKERRFVLSIILHFLNHRERLMNDFGALKTQSKMASITKVRSVIEFYWNSPVKVQAKAVLDVEEHLVNLIPGKSSRYYESSMKKITEVIQYCKQIQQSL